MLMFLPLARFFDFDGRSRRAEYWLFLLFQMIVAALFWALFLGVYGPRVLELGAVYLASAGDGGGLGGGGADDYGHGYRPGRFSFDPRFVPGDILSLLGPVGIGLIVGFQMFGLVMLIPTLAVSIRRLHDSDRSGWWLFAPLLPNLLAAMCVILAFATGPRYESGLMAAAGGFMLVATALGLAVLVFMFVDGTPGPNRFGPDSKRRYAPPAGY